MVGVRACLYLCVIFLCFQATVGKPFFGSYLWCLLCEDDDDTGTSTTASSEDYGDDFLCGLCPQSRPRTTTRNPLTPGPTVPNNPFNWQGQFGFTIPPSNNNVAVQMYQDGPNRPMMISMIPIGTAAPPAPAATAAPPTAPAAAATAAAPVTTAAPTTAAPTTAAPAA